jgi:peptidoglycan hydrolase-like protein with peptidoglycan-binding domain
MFRNYRFMSMVAAVLFSAIALGLTSTTAFAAATQATISSKAAPKQMNNVSTCPPDFRNGNRGDDIKRLQATLDKQGFRGQHGGRLPQDGVLGPDTIFALKQFQQRHHLPMTGNTDSQTWQALGQCNRR